MKRTIKLVSAAMAVIMMCCVFAACKKDPENVVSSTELASQTSAWLDKSRTAASEPSTEAVTEVNAQPAATASAAQNNLTTTTAPPKNNTPAVNNGANPGATTSSQTTLPQLLTLNRPQRRLQTQHPRLTQSLQSPRN